MTDKSHFTAKGKVVKAESSRLFRVRLDNGHTALCYKAGRLMVHKIGIIIGDTVTVELSTYDLTRGRIVYREK